MTPSPPACEQSHHTTLLCISLLPEKNVVPLIVEGDSSPALEVGVLAEYGGKHAPQAVPQARAKVVEYELWTMCACSAMMLHMNASASGCYVCDVELLAGLSVAHNMSCTHLQCYSTWYSTRAP